MSRRLPGSLVLLLPLLAVLAGCDRGGPTGDVLLVTVDTLRADHLDVYGYDRPTSPNLGALFADGAIFERAYATSSYTSSSVASLLSGRLPQEHGVRLFDQLVPARTVLVTQLLAPAFQTAGFVSSVVLTDEGFGIADRFDHYDDRIEWDPVRAGGERSARSVTDAALDWLREERDPGRPLFLWVRYVDPHGPYRPPPEWRGRFQHAPDEAVPAERVPPYVDVDGASDALDYVDRYDEEIAYTDAEVGRLLRGYGELRPLDEALVLFTADHGESLLERDLRFSHAFHVWEELVRVPLLLRGPGVEPGRRSGLVSGTDVAPTILGHAGAPAPASLRGVDLRRAGSLPPDRAIFAESIHTFGQIQWRAALQGDLKWTVAVDREGRPRRRRTYDLRADPAERAPGRWRDDPVARRLLDLVAADPDPSARPSEFERGTLTEHATDLLRRLGYVE